VSTADQPGRAEAPLAHSTSPEELTAIIRRAAALGIPAWRVTTALGLPPEHGSPD